MLNCKRRARSVRRVRARVWVRQPRRCVARAHLHDCRCRSPRPQNARQTERRGWQRGRPTCASGLRGSGRGELRSGWGPEPDNESRRGLFSSMHAEAVAAAFSRRSQELCQNEPLGTCILTSMYKSVTNASVLRETAAYKCTDVVRGRSSSSATLQPRPAAQTKIKQTITSGPVPLCPDIAGRLCRCRACGAWHRRHRHRRRRRHRRRHLPPGAPRDAALRLRHPQRSWWRHRRGPRALLAAVCTVRPQPRRRCGAHRGGWRAAYPGMPPTASSWSARPPAQMASGRTPCRRVPTTPAAPSMCSSGFSCPCSQRCFCCAAPSSFAWDTSSTRCLGRCATPNAARGRARLRCDCVPLPAAGLGSGHSRAAGAS
jgi:hypothetical protein